MDPNETLDMCIEALEQRDYEAAFYHTQDLLIWLNKGGFVPKVFGETNIATHQVARHWCQGTMKICRGLTLLRWEKNDE